MWDLRDNKKSNTDEDTDDDEHAKCVKSYSVAGNLADACVIHIAVTQF